MHFLIRMLLSSVTTKTLAVLIEPPPAIGGSKSQLPPGKVQSPSNIGVFMFLFMFCAVEIAFIKLVTYVIVPVGSTSIGTQTTNSEQQNTRGTIESSDDIRHFA